MSVVCFPLYKKVLLSASLFLGQPVKKQSPFASYLSYAIFLLFTTNA